MSGSWQDAEFTGIYAGASLLTLVSVSSRVGTKLGTVHHKIGLQASCSDGGIAYAGGPRIPAAYLEAKRDKCS